MSTITLTDAKGNRTTYQYDGHDWQVRLRYPHPTTVGTSSTTDYEQYIFDAAGNLITHRKRNGDTVTLAYDNLNRLTTRNQVREIVGHSWTNDLYQWAGYTDGTKGYTTNGLKKLADSPASVGASTRVLLPQVQKAHIFANFSIRPHSID